MANASVTALGYLELGVKSLKDWRGFAQTVLGLSAQTEGDAVNLRYDSDCWRIRLLETGEDDIRCAGFQVTSVDALQVLHARLKSQGIEVKQASPADAAARGVDHLLVCNDPFGLRVELYVGNRVIDVPFVSPRNVSGFVTDQLGLGHIVISIGDQQQAETFYMQGLGFLLSDHILMGPPGRQLKLTFLHCNPRHHSLAMAPVPSPKRLNHIMLQVATLDDVGYGLDAAIKSGVHISSTLGKHTNDQMVSCYLRTPSGFDIEYGCEGLEIDETSWQPTTYHAPSLWGHKGALN